MSSSLAAPLAPPQLWLIKISSSTLHWRWGQHWGGAWWRSWPCPPSQTPSLVPSANLSLHGLPRMQSAQHWKLPALDFLKISSPAVSPVCVGHQWVSQCGWVGITHWVIFSDFRSFQISEIAIVSTELAILFSSRCLNEGISCNVCFIIVRNVFLPLPSGFLSGPRSASAQAGQFMIMRI